MQINIEKQIVKLGSKVVAPHGAEMVIEVLNRNGDPVGVFLWPKKDFDMLDKLNEIKTRGYIFHEYE